MFIAVTDAQRLESLQEKLVRQFEQVNPSRHIVRIGHKGGQFEVEVSYSEELNMWWKLDMSINENRYWNAFGLGFPIGMVSIVVELNYHVEGQDRGIACNWAKDDNGDYFLFHNGNIRGGRPGIGPKLFRKEFTGKFSEIFLNGKVKSTALVCGLSDKDITQQIKYFVEEVQRIKYPKREQVVHRFSNEFDGERIYGLPAKVRANGNHGRVINALKSELENKGLLVGNNGDERIDLFTYKPRGAIVQIFELKTSLSIQSLCTAIGQLQLYGFYHKPSVKKTFVCHGALSLKARALLKSLDISILYFNINQRGITFSNLDAILKIEK